MPFTEETNTDTPTAANEPEEDFDTPEPEVVESDVDLPGESDLIDEGEVELDASPIEKLSKAIELNPTSTRPYIFRAKAYIKSKQPKKAIASANAALKVNPDSASAMKWKGKGEAMLGMWVQSFQTLSKAQSLDFDDETYEWLPVIKKNANIQREHDQKYAALRRERDNRKDSASQE